MYSQLACFARHTPVVTGHIYQPIECLIKSLSFFYFQNVNCCAQQRNQTNKNEHRISYLRLLLTRSHSCHSTVVAQKHSARLNANQTHALAHTRSHNLCIRILCANGTKLNSNTALAHTSQLRNQSSISRVVSISIVAINTYRIIITRKRFGSLFHMSSPVLGSATTIFGAPATVDRWQKKMLWVRWGYDLLQYMHWMFNVHQMPCFAWILVFFLLLFLLHLFSLFSLFHLNEFPFRLMSTRRLRRTYNTLGTSVLAHIICV